MRRRLSIVLSVVLGVVYILSGLLKLMDPIGTGFIMKEYMDFFGAEFAVGAAVPAGIFLSALEIIVGGLIAIRWRMQITAVISLAMMIFYSVLTLILMIYNPKMDCGCFGEAIHLSHTETFLKNVVLMVVALLPFIYRHSNSNKRKSWRNAYRLVLVGIMAVLTPVMSLMYRPFIDFTDFAPSAVVASQASAVDSEAQVTLIYEKEGRRAEFSIEDLPDSTWTFVETVAAGTDALNEMEIVDLPLRDVSGEYLKDYPERGLFIVSVPVPAKFDSLQWARINSFAGSSMNEGIPVYVAVGSDPQSWDYGLTDLPVFFSDYKTLVTLNRSNGGVSYLYTDTETKIIEKWSYRGLDNIDVSEIAVADSDMMLINATLRRSAFFQLLLFIYMLLMLL